MHHCNILFIINDQAALIGDRINCIKEMNSVELQTDSGVPITDCLMFFYGDKPASQFERENTDWGSLSMRIMWSSHFAI